MLFLFSGIREGFALQVTSNTPPAELKNKTYLYEVVRHLYRWYMDERDVEQDFETDDIVFHVCPVEVELDEGDNSRLGQIMLPQFGIDVTLKKADYSIEELGIAVSNDSYKIVNVARGARVKGVPPECEEIRLDYTEIRDYLFQTRNLAVFPDDALLEKMRSAVREELQEEIAEERKVEEGDARQEDHIVHMAPLSPVANEAWVFWENGRMLIRFASDIDLAHPGLWDHQDLAVDLYDIDEQVVVSLDEVAGSNAYMTRDQVGRALFNCVILGKRLELTPQDEIVDGPVPETKP